MSGFIKLQRTFQENMFWKKKREFSEFEALLDIVASVQYADREVHNSIGRQVITTKRGQSLFSLDTWSERWSWHKSKVRRYLALLVEQGIIEKENVKKTIRLTVVNCDFYTHEESETRTEWGLNRNKNKSVTESVANSDTKPTQTQTINSNTSETLRHEIDTRLTRERHEIDTRLTPVEERKKEKKERKKEKKKTPAQKNGQAERDFQKYLSRYSENQKDVIRDLFRILKTTRKTGKISENIMYNELQFWDRYPVENVMAGIDKYMDADYAGDGKKEQYLRGIIRNWVEQIDRLPKKKKRINGHTAEQIFQLEGKAACRLSMYGEKEFNEFLAENKIEMTLAEGWDVAAQIDRLER